MDRRSFLRGLLTTAAIGPVTSLMPAVPLSDLMYHHEILTAAQVIERWGVITQELGTFGLVTYNEKLEIVRPFRH